MSKHLNKQIPSKRKATRRLSNHVSSRHYRAPEIILLEKEYGAPADLWSLGCCLAEMVGCTTKYLSKGADLEDRVIF